MPSTSMPTARTAAIPGDTGQRARHRKVLRAVFRLLDDDGGSAVLRHRRCDHSFLYEDMLVDRLRRSVRHRDDVRVQCEQPVWLYSNGVSRTVNKRKPHEASSLASSSVDLRDVCACGTDTMPPTGPEILPDLHVTAPPAAGKGWQIITPIYEDIQPSSDLEVCTWTDIIVDHEIDLKSVTGFQNEPPGHHVVAYYTTQRQPPGTQRICNDTDMATFRFLAGAGGEGTPNAAPGDLVWRDRSARRWSSITIT